MNPFREMLNGAVPQTGRDIPIQLNPISPMSDSDQVLADGNDSAVKLLNELAARKQAFEEMLKGRINSPQMQVPSVAPNKNAALLGGLAALIGALTGDKSAVPAFGQFAGGLQQDAQAKAQRLLQEQQMKMQAQAQKDKAIGDLLGFQLEDAQNAYSRANAADVANRKAAKEAADAEAKRAFEIWKTTTEIEGRKAIEGVRQGGMTDRAALNRRPRAQSYYDWLISDEAGPNKMDPVAAFDLANKLSEREADLLYDKSRYEYLKTQIEKLKQDIKLAPQKMELEARALGMRAEANAIAAKQGWARIDLEERRVDMAESKEQPLATRLKNDGDWLSAYKNYNDSRDEYKAKEKAFKDLQQNVRVGLMSTPPVKPDAPLMMELTIAQKEFLDIAKKRNGWAKIMREREAIVKQGEVPAMPLPPGAKIGGGAPSSARTIK